MQGRRSAMITTAALAAAFRAVPAGAAEALRVGGTGGATALLERLGRSFTAETGIPVEVVPSLGSSGGLKATVDGVLGVAVAGRPLNEGEVARGLVSAATLRTPYVLATSHPSPPAMTGAEIVRAYASERAEWPDGSRIKLVLRPRAESDNLVFASLFPGMDAALEQARQRADLPVAATDQDNADLAEKLPGSLTGTTYVQVALERRDLRMITIDGAAPTAEAFQGGAYRPAKVFHVVHARQAGPAAARFVGFLRGEEGLRVLRAAGCLPGAA